jgi:hypothetical protein
MYRCSSVLAFKAAVTISDGATTALNDPVWRVTDGHRSNSMPGTLSGSGFLGSGQGGRESDPPPVAGATLMMGCTKLNGTMCGRYSLICIDDICGRFRVIDPSIGFRSHFNIAPGSMNPVIVQHERVEAIMMQWGLVE